MIANNLISFDEEVRASVTTRSNKSELMKADKKTQPSYMLFLHLMMHTRLQTKKLLKPSMF